jgi:hypothetical protein
MILIRGSMRFDRKTFPIVSTKKTPLVGNYKVHDQSPSSWLPPEIDRNINYCGKMEDRI